MSRPTVLIADTNSRTSASVAKYLDLEGFACVRASNGAEVVASLTAGPPAALLIDYAIAEPAALEIIRGLRASSNLPVVVLVEEADQQAAALLAGASVVITRPFHLATVAARLRELVPGVGPPRG